VRHYLPKSSSFVNVKKVSRLIPFKRRNPFKESPNIMIQLLNPHGDFISSDQSLIQDACSRAGIHIGAWSLDELADIEGDRILASNDIQTLALEAVKKPLKKLKSIFGYQYEDIVGLTPQTPNLDSILKAFRPEHHHEDDEVRVILHGAGIFGFVPEKGDAFELVVQKGDWIVVPALTRHYFYLTDVQTIIALRVFKDSPKWEAIYSI
jgi:1,2-dihydroxy-3-keto-5-methylthiopentene dioxygenase